MKDLNTRMLVRAFSLSLRFGMMGGVLEVHPFSSTPKTLKIAWKRRSRERAKSADDDNEALLPRTRDTMDEHGQKMISLFFLEQTVNTQHCLSFSGVESVSFSIKRVLRIEPFFGE